MVEVELNLLLIELAGVKRIKLDVGEPITMESLIRRVGLEEEDVGMMLINKAWAPFESMVRDGDLVQLYPFLEGG